MFKIGDIVKIKNPKKCDHNSYRIIAERNLAEINLPEDNFYDITDLKSSKRYKYSVPERYLILDYKYYRRTKLQKLKK